MRRKLQLLPTIVLVLFLLVFPPVLSLTLLAVAFVAYSAWVMIAFQFYAAMSISMYEAVELACIDVYRVFLA